MKQAIRKDGYKSILLYKDGKYHHVLIHRIIAISFIPNPENKPCVNHKDGDKQNNNIDNLEWVTHSENTQHSFDNKLQIIGVGKNNHLSKPIAQYDINGVFIKNWENARDIQRKLGFINGNISACCLGKKKTAYKYKWSFI